VDILLANNERQYCHISAAHQRTLLSFRLKKAS
jgi:hypothetical protein